MIQNYIPLICIVTTLLFTYLYPYYKGTSIGNITNEYVFRASPSNWAFSIWSIIFIWLFCLSIYNVIAQPIIHPVWGSICFVMPCLWVYAFLNREIELAFIALFLCAGTTITTFFIVSIDKPPYIAINGIALYAGWLCSATLLNLFIVIQYYYGNAHIFLDITFALLLICLHIIFISFASVEILRRGIAFTFVGLWTTLAIATEYQERFMIVAPVIMTCVCAVAIYRIYQIY